MNARIEELAKQAFDTIAPTDKEWFKTYSTKLAELIINDSIAAIRAKYFDRGTTEAVIAIETHFGVEE